MAMLTVEASRVIERPIGEVWKYMSNLDNMPAWDPGLVEVKWRPPLRLGMDIEMHDASPLLRMLDQWLGPFVFRVSALEDEQRFGIRLQRGTSSMEAVYSLQPIDAQHTRVTRVATADGKGAWKLLELAIRRRMLREQEFEVANPKRILEFRLNEGTRRST
jgi:Polyketide cyclase / dehydrase and lipid transport